MKYPAKSGVITKDGIQFKKTVIPEGFVMVVDTREQTPLFRRIPSGLVIASKKLNHGDYSVLGFEDMICIERKMTSDFLSYIGSERAKTQKKLLAMKDMFWKSLVIETDNPYIIPYGSKMTSEHVRGFFLSARIRYGLHIFWSKDRKEIERYVVDHLVKCYNVLREV